MNQQALVVPGLEHAAAVAAEAARTVRAYQRFLGSEGLAEQRIDAATFGLLPPMTKQNYLRQWGPRNLVRGDRVSSAAVWSASSGSSGAPTFWARDDLGTADSVEFFDRIFTEHFHSRTHDVLLVNTFAMGQWVGGVYTHEGVRRLRERGHRISLASPGMDVTAALACIEQVGRDYTQIVIAGYPPFVKEVIQAGKALGRRIGLLMAGEAITEAWRTSVYDLLDPTTVLQPGCLMYGTADAGIMGFESKLTQEVRRLAVVGSPLADDLYGSQARVAPTFVEYDPHRRFIEVDEEGYLLFTIDGATPLIRYRINDKGQILTGLELAALLRRHGADAIADRVPDDAAYLVLYGRTDVAATFYSVNIYADPLHAVFDDPSIAPYVSGWFRIVATDGAAEPPRLRIMVESAPGASCDDESLRRELRALCTAALVDANSEYRQLRSLHGEDVEPVVGLVPHGTFAAAGTAKHEWIGGAR